MKGPLTNKHRRSHLKSRTGCAVCRQRRVKVGKWGFSQFLFSDYYPTGFRQNRNGTAVFVLQLVSIFLEEVALSFASPRFLTSH